jgi:hypothetical protein
MHWLFNPSAVLVLIVAAVLCVTWWGGGDGHDGDRSS